MKDDGFDPILMEKAKKLAAGPLGEKMAKFPLMFAIAGFFGERPIVSTPVFRNATLSLVDLGHGPMAITCSHVLEAYREALCKDSRIIFQIGNAEIEPLKRIIDETKTLDLVTIDLKGENIKKISGEGEIAHQFFQPATWPPRDIPKGEFVAFGGFPGVYKSQLSRGRIEFGSFSVGACTVASVSGQNFICQIERDFWVQSFGYGPGGDLHDFGGLSGSPVFIFREYHFDFVGIAYEFSPEYDLMYVRPSKFIREDGTILRPG